MMNADEIQLLAGLGVDLRGAFSPELARVANRMLAMQSPTIGSSARAGLGDGGDGRSPPGPRISLPMRSLTSTSLNWSGAVCSARGKRFRHVMGQVKIPPAPAAPTAPRQNRDYRCSIWVGMGGHRRWDRSLPQAGIMMGFRVGSNEPFLYAWQEWFLGTSADPYAIIDDFPMTWGDDIMLGVFCEPSLKAVTTLFVNLTQNQVRISGLDSDRAMTGVTAEWIVERPSPWECLTNPYPLLDYREVKFTNCTAFADPLGNARNLRGARMVRMVERRVRPSRTHFISVPEHAAEDDGLVVRYRP